jgi:hypothetical protein
MKQKFCHLLFTLAITAEYHTQTIRGTCITVAKSQSYIEDHWIVENVLKVMSEVYNSIPILCIVNDIPHCSV